MMQTVTDMKEVILLSVFINFKQSGGLFFMQNQSRKEKISTN